MNKKRIVAFMAAATMLLNVTPVMAAETATGSATVTSSGTVSAYDKTPKYKVTLPTANALQFTVDPYGLLKIASGGSLSLEDLSNSGEIATASGSGALIKNQSSVPVTVSMKLYAEDSSNKINFMSTGENVVTGSGTNMFLALIPSSVKAGAVASYAAASFAIPVVATGSAGTEADAKFKLDKAKYEVVENSGKFTIQLASGSANYDATVFKVGGVANPGGDWSPFIASGSAATLSLGVVFDYKQAEDTDVINESAGVYGLVSGSAANITDKMGSTSSEPISGSKMIESEIDGIDYDVTEFSVSHDYVISINDGRTVTAVAIGPDKNSQPLAVNNAINATNHTVTIPANTLPASAANQRRVVKLETSEGTVLIRLMCVQ